MENNNTSASSSFPATPIPNHSQWLQTTLSDLDGKMKAMMILLEEPDKSNSSSQKADTFCNRNQELVKMLQDMNRSYCSLAHKYDQLRSKSQNLCQSGSSSLSYNTTEIKQAVDQRRVIEASNDATWEASDTCHEPVVDDSDYEHCRSDFEYLNKLADDLVLTEQCNNVPFMRKPEEQARRGFSDEEDVAFKKGCSEKENSRFRFTKLMEETLRQQAELLRRNGEKRVTINRLLLKLEQLKSENKILHLQKCLYCSKIGLKRNHSQNSRSAGLFLGKLFNGGGCS